MRENKRKKISVRKIELFINILKKKQNKKKLLLIIIIIIIINKNIMTKKGLNN